MEHFDSVKSIIENLRSENAELRLESMRAVHVIASALGPRRTREELLLYLTDYLDDSDDVLCVFARALGTMLAEVGDMPHVASLLKPLETLCSLDEVTVRDEAVSALQLLGRSIFGVEGGTAAAAEQDISHDVSAPRANSVNRVDALLHGSSSGEEGVTSGSSYKAGTIHSRMTHPGTSSTTATNSPTSQNRDASCSGNSVHHLRAQEEYVAMITRLAAGTPQCRSSACGLVATAYAHGSSDVQAKMLALFRDLCADKEIMVRRAACIALGTELVCALGPRRGVELVPTLREFASMSSDGVRLQAVQTAVAMLSVLPEVQHGPVLQIFRELASDESWRVRYMAADALNSLVKVIASGDVVHHVIPVFRSLCQDAEPEIRASAVYAMPAVLAGCRADKVANQRKFGLRGCAGAGQDLPMVRSRSSSANKRLTSAEGGGVSESESEGLSGSSNYTNNYKTHVNNTNSNNTSNTAAAAASKDVLVTGTRLLSDSNGHVRMSLAGAVLKSVPHMEKELWVTTVVPTCAALLADTEADVRLALVSSFSVMGNTAEAKELAPRLVPVVITLASDPKWRLREVVVSQVPYIIMSLGHNAEEVLEVCLERLTDRVASIRTAAVQSCCELIAKRGTSWAARQLLPRINELVKDTNYLHRVTLCHLYRAMAELSVVDGRWVMATVWPVVQQLVSDVVPNVRMNISRAIRALAEHGKVTKREADGLLLKLSADPVCDVRDAAAAAGGGAGATEALELTSLATAGSKDAPTRKVVMSR